MQNETLQLVGDFWVYRQCIIGSINQRFGGIYCPHLQVRDFETSEWELNGKSRVIGPGMRRICLAYAPDSTLLP
jgi:hypothetical protein